jgi:hypothetical protein
VGTGTQLGSVINVSLEIYEFSTEQDRQMLIQAFEKGQNQGLVNTLSRMKAVGHCSITGTLGYDVSFVGIIHTLTGRKIRFVTNRQLRFGEVYLDTQSTRMGHLPSDRSPRSDFPSPSARPSVPFPDRSWGALRFDAISSQRISWR